MPVKIRALELDDVDEVAALSLRVWAPVHASMAAVLGPELNARINPDWAASQESDVRAACGDEQMLVSVAQQDGRVVGFVAVLPRTREPGTGEIDMVAVDPAVQGSGAGRALTDHALAQLRAAGCTLAVVATGGDDGHAPARSLYAAAGFTPLPLARYYQVL